MPMNAAVYADGKKIVERALLDPVTGCAGRPGCFVRLASREAAVGAFDPVVGLRRGHPAGRLIAGACGFVEWRFRRPGGRCSA